MSRKRQFAKYVNSVFASEKIKETAESVWVEMDIGIPEWPHKEGDVELIVRTGVIPAPLKDLEPIRILRLRLMQRFNQGDPAQFVECEIFGQMIIDITAERGLPQDNTFEEDLRETLRLELWALKDYFFKTVNEDRITGMN